MGIQYRLGTNDHKPVEDFVARDPLGTSSIVLDTKAAARQRQAAQAARDAGLQVYWDPGVERLAAPGYNLDRHPMWAGDPYSVDELAGDGRAREHLVTRTLAAHPDGATHTTAPHFFIDGERTADLNVDLAERTVLNSSLPTRAVVTIGSRIVAGLASRLASELAQAGVPAVELRISPLGGEDEGLAKIRTVFEVLETFKVTGMHVTLGQSGNIGQMAFALGAADAFSVGIGLLQRVDHKTAVNRQKKAPKPRDDDSGGGPLAGIYLPGIALTVPRRAGEKLLEHTDVRTRLSCRLGDCADSVRGPAADPRGHYLHARAAEVQQLLATLPRWRAMQEVQRLRQANDLRRRINSYHVDGDIIRAMKTRTIMSLINTVDQMRRAS